MGLDMYLTGSIYCWGADGIKLKKRIKKLIKTDYEVSSVKIEVGYWRKANQIHKWFVDNVQKGKDNCEEYYVDDDQLKNLLKLVNKALKSKHPEKILPNQSGFFFGSTAYDEYYKKDLESTKEIIEKWFNNPNKNDIELYYRASW